jgi:hypothetical protein
MITLVILTFSSKIQVVAKLKFEMMNNTINAYLNKVQEIDTSIGVSKVIKIIDKLTQELYLELYNVKPGVDVRCPQPQLENRGHCC